MKWQERAKCNGQNPMLWDSDWLRANTVDPEGEARAACAGCPVVRECRADAAGLIDVSGPFNRCAESHNAANVDRDFFVYVPLAAPAFRDVAGVVRAGFLL